MARLDQAKWSQPRRFACLLVKYTQRMNKFVSSFIRAECRDRDNRN